MYRQRGSGLGLAGVAGLLIIATGLAPMPASAQLSSGAPIRIIVPFAPAGSSDVLARVLQVPLQQALNHTVIVENRAGAGSNLGTVEVARARPDGYTLLLTSSAFVVNPGFYKNVPYDPFKQFAPIAALPVAPNILVTQAKSDLSSVRDVIARAKADPQALNYASPGNGTTPQLAMELLKLKAGINVTNVPYGGGGPATQALLSGTVQLLQTALPGAIEQVRAGAMKGLAITTTERWPDLPNVPTYAELGYPEVGIDTAHFLLAPAGTPPDVLDLITKAAQSALGQNEVKQRVFQLGYAFVAGGPDVAKQRIAKEVPFFKELIANAKIPQIE
jgi:tripartite-type tricarboxylate transporter receptor subunit TctC